MLEVKLEDMNSQFDLILEGHAALDSKIDHKFDELSEKYMETISKALSAYQPKEIDPRQSIRSAAVALLLRGSEDSPEVLLIERSSQPNDPWSGNLSFPGGRIDDTDASALAAAIRETSEEVGLSLRSDQLLGRLDDLHGTRVPIKVSCFVFKVAADQQPVINEEVQHAMWVSLSLLQQPHLHALRSVNWHGTAIQVPSIYIDDSRPPLWGLTYRFMCHFFKVVGTSLSELPQEPPKQF